jgi:hypothetical protein
MSAKGGIKMFKFKDIKEPEKKDTIEAYEPTLSNDIHDLIRDINTVIADFMEIPKEIQEGLSDIIINCSVTNEIHQTVKKININVFQKKINMTVVSWTYSNFYMHQYINNLFFTINDLDEVKIKIYPRSSYQVNDMSYTFLSEVPVHTSQQILFLQNLVKRLEFISTIKHNVEEIEKANSNLKSCYDIAKGLQYFEI